MRLDGVVFAGRVDEPAQWHVAVRDVAEGEPGVDAREAPTVGGDAVAQRVTSQNSANPSVATVMPVRCLSPTTTTRR